MSMSSGGFESIGNETNFNITFSSFFKGVSAMNRTSLTSLFRGWKGAGKKLPALLAAGALAAMLNSCGDNVVETKGSNAIKDATNKTASVSIFIRNGGGTGDISNEDVTVEFYGTSGSSYEVQSVDLGRENKGKYYEVTRGGIVFKDVPLGDYAVRVSKTEYATFFADDITVSVTESELENGVYIPKSVRREATLYPLTGAVSGTATYAFLSKSKATGDANGAKVTLVVGKPEIEHRVFTEEVRDGKFSFSRVPAGTDLTGTLYASLGEYAGKITTPIQLLPGVNTPVKGGIVLEFQPDLLVLDYDVSVSAADDITIKFSENIDEKTIGNVNVYGDAKGKTTVDGKEQFNVRVAVDRVVSGNTLTLSPKNGSWQLNDTTGLYEANANLQVSLGNLASTTNKAYAGGRLTGIKISTSVKVFQVVGENVITLPTKESSFDVSFSQAVDVSSFDKNSYDFKTTAGGSNAQSIKEPEISSDGKTITFEPSNTWSLAGGLHIVFASNFKSEDGVPITTPASVEIKVRDTAHVNLAISQINGKAWEQEMEVTLAGDKTPVVVEFNKPVDTVLLTSASIVALNGTNAVSLEKKWSNNKQTLTLTPWDKWPRNNTGHELKLTAFRGDDEDTDKDFIVTTPSAKATAKLIYREGVTLSYAGPEIIKIGTVADSAIRISFDRPIETDSVILNNPFVFESSASLTGAWTAAQNFGVISFENNNKTIVITPVGDWNFNKLAFLRISINNRKLFAAGGDETGLAIGTVLAYLESGAVRVVDKKVTDLKVTFVDTATNGTNPSLFPEAGKRIAVSFKRLAKDSEEDIFYVLYRRRLDSKITNTAEPVFKIRAKDQGPSETIEFESEGLLSAEGVSIATSGTGYATGLTVGLLGGGRNVFFVVPQNDLGYEGLPSAEVTLTTIPRVTEVRAYPPGVAVPTDRVTKGGTAVPINKYEDNDDFKFSYWKIASSKNFDVGLAGTGVSKSSTTGNFGPGDITLDRGVVFEVVFSEEMNSNKPVFVTGRNVDEDAVAIYGLGWNNDGTAYRIGLKTIIDGPALFYIDPQDKASATAALKNELLDFEVSGFVSAAGQAFYDQHKETSRRGDKYLAAYEELNIVYQYNQLSCVQNTNGWGWLDYTSTTTRGQSTAACPTTYED